MPTYDYKCTNCGHVFEEFHMMSDAPVEACPECGSPVERLIGGGAGIIFKGKGFYVTDSRNTKTSSTPAAGTETKTGEKSSDGEKKESTKESNSSKKDSAAAS
ncbi:MAG: FmdB family zinc ribbon protein [Spirochaetota bacterium]